VTKPKRGGILDGRDSKKNAEPDSSGPAVRFRVYFLEKSGGTNKIDYLSARHSERSYF
jgi:hypothetical protein